MGANRKAGTGAASELEVEISAWLREGGWVIAASERAARALTAAHHRARRAQGLTAWLAPAIFDWHSFLRAAWQQTLDGRLVLDPLKEQSVWARIAGGEQYLATQLEEPLYRMADLAMEAHRLLCSYAPQYLNPASRRDWQQDAATFSNWLSEFDETCRAASLVSTSRLMLETIAQLEETRKERPPLLLAGFDRILPIQRKVFDAWGTWRQAQLGEAAREIRFYSAADARSELIACALWCKRQLAADCESRLLVITQEVERRRGEIERVFQNFASADGHASSRSALFEFSLGIRLSQVALARGAGHVLRFLTDALEEHELDWLLSAGQLEAEPYETMALQIYMKKLRDRGLERPKWSLGAFLAQPSSSLLPSAWVSRVLVAQRRLAEYARTERSAFEWAEMVPQILEAAGWPGARPLSSEEFQARRRWEQAVENCASLGFDGRRISWKGFLSRLTHTVNETLFAPESQDAPIQISGAAEAAGLTADAIWFMGATEEAWPSSGNTHPLLPLAVQRAWEMPHATPRLDWDLSRSMTVRLLKSSSQICFSYARQNGNGETRRSPLIAQIAGMPEPLPAELAAPAAPRPLAKFVEDVTLAPFSLGTVDGGASLLTHQSQCPFKAFATARLAARDWQPAQAGLKATQRGQLLHAVLHSIWGEAPPLGIRTLNDLKSMGDNRDEFIAAHVSRAIQQLPRGVRERMPQNYLDLEQRRLHRLVSEWLDYEATRFEFAVMKTEDERSIEIAGLSFNLRLDRIDRLNDGTLLVIDYKTGLVSSKSWELPRPDDVQLPLYASFALCEREALGGLVFAQVRSGQSCFLGNVGNAGATMFPGMNRTCSLVKRNLTGEMILDWRNKIEALAKDFLAGRSEADPRDYPTTCKHCRLETLCRIHETRSLIEDETSAENDEVAGDE